MMTITIVADDKVGLLADISYILGKARLNIESINVDVVAKKSIITLTVSDPERAKSVLEASGYKMAETNAVVVKLSDQPGELARITSTMAADGINIENVHMLSRDGKTTILALTVDKPKKAIALLAPYLMSREEEV